jgi:hypothetical protein
VPDGHAGRVGRPRPGSARRRRRDRAPDRRRGRRRLPAPARRPSRPRSIATGCTDRRPAATSPTTRGGSGCSAGRRSRRSAARATGRSTSSTSTTGTADRRRSSATPGWPTTRSSGGRRSSPRSTTSPTTAGRTGELRQLGLVPGGGIVPATPRRRPAPRGDRPVRGGEHRQPGLRPRGADAGGWASGSTTRCGRRATGSSGSSTGSTRCSGTGDRPDLAAPYSADDLTGGRLPARPADRLGFDPRTTARSSG